MDIHIKKRFEILEEQDGHFCLVLRTEERPRRIRIRPDRFTPLDLWEHSFLAEIDDNEWLRELVRLGELARKRLLSMDQTARTGWRDLWPLYLGKAVQSPSATGMVSYERWVRILAEWAEHHRQVVSLPRLLTMEQAAQCLNDLADRYVSTRRMALFFKRLWETLGWDGNIWKLRVRIAEGEYYRRLTVVEVRRLVRHLSNTRTRINLALAEVIVLGYYTGLRLSDIVELEVGEIDAAGTIVRLRPNKTRARCRRSLVIPLVGEARRCVRKRLTTHGAKMNLIFPELVGIRVSRLFSAAFRSCHILKHDNGRASFHSLRATFISMMDEAGIPPHITDAITGHSGGGMHARYTQPSISVLAAAIRKAITPLNWYSGSDGMSEPETIRCRLCAVKRKALS